MSLTCSRFCDALPLNTVGHAMLRHMLDVISIHLCFKLISVMHHIVDGQKHFMVCVVAVVCKVLYKFSLVS